MERKSMDRTIEIKKLAKIIRSKNAGPFKITLDIIFQNLESYEKVQKSKILDKKLISNLYGLSNLDDISVVEFDQAAAIKITFPRIIPSGNIGDSDVYGAQQHTPLYTIRIPWN